MDGSRSDVSIGKELVLETNTPMVMEMTIDTQSKSNVFLSEDCLSDLPERSRLFSIISDKSHKK